MTRRQDSQSADENEVALDHAQVTELIGRNRLIEELLVAGLEVAVPQRDRGVDLIAHADRDSGTTPFVASPIQVKVSSAEQFSIDRKYGKVPGLILAFIWHVHDPKKAITCALTYREALAIGAKMHWTSTRSWREGGKYATQRPSDKLKQLLRPHRMTTRDLWRRKVSAGIGHNPNNSLQEGPENLTGVHGMNTIHSRRQGRSAINTIHTG